MANAKIRTALALVVFAAALALVIIGPGKYLSFDSLRENRRYLLEYVDARYFRSVVLFVAAYMSTALFVPGALVLAAAGGLLFGAALGALYVDVAGTAGALVAFVLSRHLVGNWLQRRYSGPLKAFNSEFARHGHNYLLSMRIVPVLPFFLVNYFAGLTRVSLWRFAWTTSLGMLPGSVVYAFAGSELASINSPRDLFAPELLLALCALALLVLCPALRGPAARLFHKAPR
jgi:uncharacterized membrane protein YdjX (TVP38/TMEM64 family)